MEVWKAADAPSLELRRELPALREALDASLKPASRRSLAVAISNILEFSAVFGASASDVKAASSGYAEVLGDLPEDLLSEAVMLVKRHHRYNTLPRPADVRGHVSAEWSRRKVARMRAIVAERDALRSGLEVGLLAREAAGIGARTLSPETEALLAEHKKRNRGAARDAWKRDAPTEVRPRPDLVAKWSEELGIEAPVG